MTQLEAPGIRLVVAHTDAALRETAARLLRAVGFEVIAVSDGESARCLMLSEPMPAILVAGVALSSPPFYSLCELVKERGLDTKILIVSSEHSSGAYKRAPESLYGADACIEEHLLAEELVEKVSQTLAASEPGPS